MPRTNIRGGVWFRNVPWANGHYWRTDIPTSVFFDPNVRAARYALNDGPIVEVPMADLRLALANSPERDAGRKIGPYNIDPFKKTLEGTTVTMGFGPFADLRLDEVHKFHQNRFGLTQRPAVAQKYYEIADIILESVGEGAISHELLAERLRSFNPTLNLRLNRDGCISRSELAYAVRVNYLRALDRSVDELTEPR